MLKGRRFTPALIVAMIALAVALSGTAVAGTAKLITGSQIANGTIKLEDISSSAKTALKGKTGATGSKGDAGAMGATGAKGDGREGRAKGDKGDKGEKGDTGVPGTRFAPGATRRTTPTRTGSGLRRRRLWRDRHGRLLTRQGRDRRRLPVQVAG